MREKENVLDYQAYYEYLKENDYIPLRINDEWLLENEDFLRENLYSFYIIYSNCKNPDEMLKPLFKLYAEITLNAYNHFEGRGHYL